MTFFPIAQSLIRPSPVVPIIMMMMRLCVWKKKSNYSKYLLTSSFIIRMLFGCEWDAMRTQRRKKSFFSSISVLFFFGVSWSSHHTHHSKFESTFLSTQSIAAQLNGKTVKIDSFCCTASKDYLPKFEFTIYIIVIYSDMEIFSTLHRPNLSLSHGYGWSETTRRSLSSA